MSGEINCFSDSALWKHPNAHIYRIIYRFWELIINTNFAGGLSEGAVILSGFTSLRWEDLDEFYCIETKNDMHKHYKI